MKNKTTQHRVPTNHHRLKHSTHQGKSTTRMSTRLTDQTPRARSSLLHSFGGGTTPVRRQAWLRDRDPELGRRSRRIPGTKDTTTTLFLETHLQPRGTRPNGSKTSHNEHKNETRKTRDKSALRGALLRKHVELQAPTCTPKKHTPCITQRIDLLADLPPRPSPSPLPTRSGGPMG